MASWAFLMHVGRSPEHCWQLYYVRLGYTIHENLPPQRSTIAVPRRLRSVGLSGASLDGAARVENPLSTVRVPQPRPRFQPRFNLNTINIQAMHQYAWNVLLG